MKALLLIQTETSVKSVELSENTTIISLSNPITIRETSMGDPTLLEKFNSVEINYESNSIVACGNGPYSVRYTTYKITGIRANIQLLNNSLIEL